MGLFSLASQLAGRMFTSQSESSCAQSASPPVPRQASGSQPVPRAASASRASARTLPPHTALPKRPPLPPLKHPSGTPPDTISGEIPTAPSKAPPVRTAAGKTSNIKAFRNRLHRAASDILQFFSADVVARNDSNVPCATARVVSVDFIENGRTTPQLIHANMVDIERPCLNATGTSTQCYPAGQSPNAEETKQFLACEKMLVQGIESGLGVYQFVSPRAHYRPQLSREKPIIATLLDRWNNSNSDVILGGRFRVTAITEHNPPKPGVLQAHKQVQLTVTDIHSADQTPRIIALTQIGLHMERADPSNNTKAKKILNANQITCANTLLEEHRVIAQARPLSDALQTQPLIVSYAGYGRNATLIAYSEIKDRIDAGIVGDTQSIEAALDEVIEAGRKVRGSEVMQQGTKVPVGKFVHSDAQRAALCEALNMHLSTHLSTHQSTQQSTQQSTHLSTHLSDEQAIQRAGHGVGVSTDTPAGRAFNSPRWNIGDNPGGGDCLFYSLAMTKNNPEPAKRDALEIRRNVANVLARIIATPAEERGNLHQYNHACAQLDLPQEKIRTGMTNIEFSKFQEKQGVFAGYMEIQQWLALPENQKKTVVVVDVLPGGEALKTYAHNQKVDVKNFFNSSNVQNEQEIFDEIQDAIYGRAQQHPGEIRTIPEDRIILRQSVVHFSRILGTLTPAQAAKEARKKAVDRIEQERLACGVDISKL